MIILPSTGRRAGVERLFESMGPTTGTGVLIHEEKDSEEYKKIKMPPAWERAVNPTGGKIGAIFNCVFERTPYEAVFQILADDVVIETPGWSRILREAAMKKGIAYGDDGIDRMKTHGIDRLATHPCIAGWKAREMGWLAAPWLKHFYIDQVWQDLGAEYIDEVKMPHLHWAVGLSEKDETYKNRPSSQEDKEAYEQNRHLYADILPG